MEQELALEAVGGKLALREDGGRLCARASGRDPGDGVYKVWLFRDNARFPLGTLCPDGTGKTVSLARTLFRAELERADCWPPLRAEAVRAFTFTAGPAQTGSWTRADRAGELLGDEVLRRCASECGPALLRREPGGFTLAYPWHPDERFPLPPLFCLGTCGEAETRPCVLFSFDRAGLPRGRRKSGES